MQTRSLQKTLSLLCSVALVSAAVIGATRAEAQTNAYVARSGANSVTVIDTAADAVLGTIAAGNGPRGVAISRDGSRAYVTNTASDSITVIETSTNTAVGTIAVGNGPSGLAVTPDGTRLYVTVEGGLVQAIDTTLGTVVATIPVLGGSGGGSIAITPDGTRAYVAWGGVTVIDIPTNTVVHSFLTGTFSVSVAISPDGTRAYVATVFYNFNNPAGFSASGSVVVLDTATDTAIKTIGLFSSLPSSIALAPDGAHGYVAIQSTWVNTGYGAGFLPGRSVAVIDTLAGTVTGSTDVGKAAAAVAVTPDGSSVYVTIPVINSVATDLLVRFKMGDTAIRCRATAAVLKARTFSGVLIEGTDSVKTVNCK